MTKIVLAIASALALATGAAQANNDKTASSTPPSDKTTASDKSTTSTTASDKTTASADNVSGDLKSTDPMANTIVVVLSSGEEQKVNVGKTAQITRDGTTASLTQLQPGDNVRASFDPKTHEASKIEVKSKSGAKSNDKDKAPSNPKM